MIFSFWMLVTAAKLLTHCIKMCSDITFKLYFLTIFSIVRKWWVSMKQLNTVIWICNIKTVLCKMIMTAVKIWSYCLSVVNCVTENEENMISIKNLYLNHLQLNCRKCRHKIHSSLWMKQSSIKVNDKACENLHTVNHYWHLKKTFEKTAWLMNWVKEAEYSFCNMCLNAWVTHIAALRISCSKAQT